MSQPKIDTPRYPNLRMVGLGVVRRCGLLSGAAPRTDILKLMTDDSFTARETLLVITGAAIAFSFYKHDYRHGILCFVAALVLGFVFFRKRKLALVTTSLGSVLALGSLGFPFHPSFAGLVLLLGCAAALYLTVRWSYKKYPYLSYKHVHTVFEGEAAMRRTHA
jgi:hypothetical protein